MQFRAEVFDQLQLLYESTGFNDHQLHCVLRFAAPLQSAVLEEAFRRSILAVPILGTRYVDLPRYPHWESTEPASWEGAFLRTRTEEEFGRQLMSPTNERRGPQVRLCVLESESSAIALTMNHMICDAAGFKEYLYLLCDIYSQLRSGTDYRPEPVTGDRGMRSVLRRVGLATRLTSLLRHGAENNRGGEHRFPLSESGDTRPFILTRKLGRDVTATLKAYCNEQKATLNDAALTAYFRCLFRRLAVPSGGEISIPLMVDMRRYLEDGRSFQSLTNLSSTVIIALTYVPEEDFAETLERVKAAVDEKKRGNIGLNGFVKLSLLFRLLPNAAARRLLESSLRNPLLCTTNVGILEGTHLSFGGERPSDAFLCGSIKYKPHFQLALSSYNGELTFSSNLYGSDDDRARVATFLEEIEQELTGRSHGTTGNWVNNRVQPDSNGRPTA